MKFFRRSPEQRRHVRGLFRAFAYLSLTAVAFSALSLRSARAEMKEHTLTLGRQMLELARATHHDVTPISFNGQKMYLASSVSDDSPKSIIDRYEEHCKSNPGQPSDWKDLEKQVGGKTAEVPAIASTGLLRTGDDNEETIVCFVRGSETKATTAEAFKAFAETGELGAFGKLRHAYAKRTPSGRTLLLTAWTEEKFNILDMIPEEGKDAPGSDFPEIPRVPNSNRTLSAYAEGTPYGVNVYKTSDPPAKVLAYYDSEMVKLGYVGYDPELDEAKEGGTGHAYVKDGVVLTVAARVDPEGTFVALGLAGVSADETLGRVKRSSSED
ncbi:MAG TPA: hypothetical protein VM580_33335 [Labilithrix sp.]|nr:hypothetical protein [Labilithrix sp.]